MKMNERREERSRYKRGEERSRGEIRKKAGAGGSG
jgi:hypothetical protein